MLTCNTASNTFGYSNRSRPYLKIQDGCNFTCTYCTVPIARGRSRSLPVFELVRQAKEIEAAGYNEIVLTGIHIGTYGYDLNPKTKLSYLIKTLLRDTKIQRLRLSSIEVKEVDKELMELLQEKRICKHIHLPLQSGDDTILKLMNRMYTSKDYVSTIEDIIKSVPNIAIGTDVIIGFPGEGDKHFLNTKRFLDSLPISYMHIFPFSSRPNTLASKMSMQNAPFVKRQRFRELNALNMKKKTDYMLSQINETLDIIIEGECKDKTLVGTSSNYLKLRVTSNRYSKGDHVYVRVSGVEDNMLKGDLIEKL